jgi:hypothetical protein
MSDWIPALHAGMTNRGVLLKVTEAPPPLFSKERTKDLARQSRNHKNERSPSNISPVAGEKREGAQRFVG